MENRHDKPANPLSRKLSRRRFLQAAIGTVATLGLGLGINALFRKGSNNQDVPLNPEGILKPEETLKQEIANQFNVELLNLRDLWSEVGMEYPDDNPRPDFAYYRNVPKSWDLERLTLLKEVLSNLPPHMYAPNEEGKRFRIVLSYVSGINGAFVREDGKVRQKRDPKSHQVELNHQEFKIGSAKEPFEILAHELSHIVTPQEIISDSLVTNGISYPFERTVSPWFDKIYEILDRDLFTGKPSALYNQLQAARTTNTDPNKEYFYQTLDYALKSNFDPNEFIGVMGGNYTHGYNYFSSMYGMFFPPKIVTDLYNFTKDQVYRGIEFPSFPTQSYHNPAQRMKD